MEGWRIRITHGDGVTEYVDLAPGVQLRFGTGDKADVRLRGEGIRSVHLGIVTQNDKYVAVAAKSVGFFKHNAKVVSRAQLSAGDTITLGEVTLEVENAAASGPAANGLEELADLETLDALEELDALESLDELDPLSEVLATDELGGAEGVALQPDMGLLSDSDALGTASAMPGVSATAQVARPAKHGSNRGLPKWLLRGMIGSGLLVWFVVTAVFILRWEVRSEIPIVPAQLLEQGEWSALETAAQAYLDENGRSPYKTQVRAWRNIGRWNAQFDREGFTVELTERISGELREHGAEYWEAAAQDPLTELLGRVADAGVEEAQRQLRRRNAESGIQAAASVRRLMVAAVSSLDAARLTKLAIDERLIAVDEIQRRLERPGIVESSVAKIREVGKRSGLAAALTERDRVLARYPDVRGETVFERALSEIALLEKQRVVVQSRPDSFPSESVSVEVFAERPINGQARLHAISDLSRGTIDLVTANGKRVARIVVDSTIPGPFTVPWESGGVVVALRRSGVLFRVDGAGKVAWSIRLPGPLLDVQVADGKLAVVMPEGAVYQIAGDTGEPIVAWHLPLPIDQGPMYDATRDWLWVAGNRAVVFALNWDSGTCERVWYTGHAPAGILTPPFLVGDRLGIVERTGANECRVQLRDVATAQVVATQTLDSTLYGRAITQGNVVLTSAADNSLRRLRVAENSGAIELVSWPIWPPVGDARMMRGNRASELLLLGRHLLGVRWLPTAQRPTVLWKLPWEGTLLEQPIALGLSTLVPSARGEVVELIRVDRSGQWELVNSWLRRPEPHASASVPGNED